MTSQIFSHYELPILTYLAETQLSASHSLEHLQTVLAYAKDLQSIHGGSADCIVAAVLLHDLGRNDVALHGAASAAASSQMAVEILQRINFPSDQVNIVLQAIQEHDQPSLRPSTIEGRILKDADFLAGFGATGIIRSALWTGESGGNSDDLLIRLETKMAARIASLEFAESRYTAQQEYLYVRSFLDELRKPHRLRPMPTVPYVVIEGISGSGKSTQAQQLAELFRQNGHPAMLLHEPTDWFTSQKKSLPPEQADPISLLHLLLTDRMLNVHHTITSSLAKNIAVISSRSYLSTIVYQQNANYSSATIAILHRILPQPTHIILLDLPAEEALRRIERREHSTHPRQRGSNEYAEQLRVHRNRFLQLKSIFPQMVVVDTQNSSHKETHQQIWRMVQSDSSK